MACQRTPGPISLSYLTKPIFIQFSSIDSDISGSESATIQLPGSFWPMDVEHPKDNPVLQLN